MGLLDTLVAASLALAFVLAVILYIRRRRQHGRFRSERADRFGGTRLLPMTLVEIAYWALDPLVRWLVRRGATADTMSWTCLALALVSGGALGVGWLGVGAFLGFVSAFADILDGLVARHGGGATVEGAVLDSAIDRYAESAFLLGLAIHLRSEPLLQAFTGLALVGCWAVSYATAKAEAVGIEPPRGGIMRRQERAFYLIVGAGLTPLLAPWLAPTYRNAPIGVALSMVAVLANISAAWRFSRLRRAVRQRAAQLGSEPVKKSPPGCRGGGE